MKKDMVLMWAVWAALLSCMLACPAVEISNKKGEVLVAELLSVGETSAKLKKVNGGATFEVGFDLLSEASVKMLREKAAELPVVYPPFELDVVVSKRRRSSEGSYYMKSMRVGGKITISNRSMKTDFPATKGRIVYVGQDQRIKSIYSVLAVSNFEVSPKAGKEQEIPLPEFVTTYDSDNKGYGNIGGFKYEAYMVMLYDEKGAITYSKSLDGKLSKAVTDNPKVLESFLTIAQGARLTDKMLPAPDLR